MFIIFFALFVFVFTVRENIWIGGIILVVIMIALLIFYCFKKLPNNKIFSIILLAFTLSLGSFLRSNLDIIKSSASHSLDTSLPTGQVGFNKGGIQSKSFFGTGVIQDTYTAGKYIFTTSTASYILQSKQEHQIGEELFLVGRMGAVVSHNARDLWSLQFLKSSPAKAGLPGVGRGEKSSTLKGTPSFKKEDKQEAKEEHKFGIKEDKQEATSFLAFDYAKWLKMKGLAGVIYETNSSLLPPTSSKIKGEWMIYESNSTVQNNGGTCFARQMSATAGLPGVGRGEKSSPAKAGLPGVGRGEKSSALSGTSFQTKEEHKFGIKEDRQEAKEEQKFEIKEDKQEAKEEQKFEIKEDKQEAKEEKKFEIKEEQNGCSGQVSSLGRIRQTKKSLQQKVISLYGKNKISGLILGMLIGDRSLIPTDDYKGFVNSGLVHLIAVSGGNLVMITVFLGCILFFLPFYLRSGVILLAIIFYALLCGLDSSVFRAVITGGLSLLALFRGKEIPIWRLLSIAFVAMLIVNPYYLVYDVGFLMSFAAVIGIIYISQNNYVILRETKNISSKQLYPSVPSGGQTIAGCRKILLYIRKNYLQPSVGATMGVFPIIIFFMGQLNLLSIIGNLFVLPIIPFVMIYGFVSIPLSQLLHRQRLLLIEKFLILYIYKVSEISSSFGLYLSISGWMKRMVLLGFLSWFIWKRMVAPQPGEGG